jgi:glycosyltransferase involved in cell wall biosynthesis
MRPINIPAYVQKCWTVDRSFESVLEDIKKSYSRLRKDGEPQVSVVVPAYNEAENIVQTLASLCNNETSRSVEIIVVNNNSKDDTAELVVACGVTCLHQTIQGITPTRNFGLQHASGTYILNADADTIYPKDWIEEMVKPLDDEKVAVTYGRFSFIPVGSTGRTTYFFYEYLADFSRSINKVIKDEAVCVYGFNSGFRREQGLQVDGFNHPPGTNEDGWLALKLRNAGFGKLHHVNAIQALVWTTDRRIQIDGGLIPGMLKRIKRVLFRN